MSSKETKSCKNCRFDKFDHPITCEFCGDDYTKWQPKEQAPTEIDSFEPTDEGTKGESK